MLEITQFWPVLLLYSIINASITNLNSIEPACHEFAYKSSDIYFFNPPSVQKGGQI
jgi:hypothetical protein